MTFARVLTTLVVAVLGVSLTLAADKKPASKNTKPKVEKPKAKHDNGQPKLTKAQAAKLAQLKAKVKAQDNHLVAHLSAAYAILKAADPIYNGHRGKAVHEIHAAIGQLEKEMKAGKQPYIKHTTDVPRSISHSLVNSSRENLIAISHHLNAMGKTPHRVKANQHVQAAVHQLNLALTFAKFAEANALK